MRNPLIVTDGGSAQLPFIGALQSYLAEGGLTTAVFSGISPNPQDREVSIGKEKFHQGSHDGVIAIGGGSGMDGGKAIALVANNEIDLWKFEYDQVPPEITASTAFPPLITIPTTAGTGAETESTAMITDTKKLMKWCVWHPQLKPAFAVLDPELTIGLPKNLTAWTGTDALVHAIEAYCVPGFNPLCDAMALEGMRLIFNWLPVTHEDPNNLGARGAMLSGSCLAGVAFLKGLGLVHAISHMIGAEYDTQHGLTNAIILPAALRFNEPEISEKIKPMANTAGLADTNFDAFYNHVCLLLDQLQIPVTLADIGVPEDCSARIAQKAIKDSAAATNPRKLDIQAIELVLKDAIVHGR